MKKPIPFGKYVLLDRINVGGMAEVFLAKVAATPGFEHLLAIKKILPTMVEDEEFITMFLDEARISVQLNHPNVVQIHELGRQDENFYIAMDYVAGKDLRTLLERYRRRKEIMPTAMAVFLGIQMAEGLDYAHKKKDAADADLNIVHRDVSPQNILIAYAGEVKIIDFGIAKAANRAQKTQAGILKGKFGYMSPEQVRGLPIDRRSDIFALGVVLFEMLTGEKLFVGESDFSTLEKVRNAEVPSPRQFNGNIPPALEKVMYRALAREVEDRYQWGSELAEDLTRFLSGGETLYGAKQLSQFMKEAFAEDVMREQKRIESFAALEPPRPVEPANGSGPTARGAQKYATPGKVAAAAPTEPPLPSSRPAGRSSVPLMSSRGAMRAAPAVEPAASGRRSTGGGGQAAVDPVAAALAELDGPTFQPGQMQVPAEFASPPPPKAPRAKPAPSPGDPNNPYIPPPSAEEMAEMGTSDRTEIFKPAFGGGGPVSLEPPRGVAQLARDVTDTGDLQSVNGSAEGESNATMIGIPNGAGSPAASDSEGATLMMNGHGAAPAVPLPSSGKRPNVSMGKVKAAPQAVEPSSDEGEGEVETRAQNLNRIKRSADADGDVADDATGQIPSPARKGQDRGRAGPPPAGLEPATHSDSSQTELPSDESSQESSAEDESNDTTRRPAKKEGRSNVPLIVIGTAFSVVVVAVVGYFGVRWATAPPEGSVIITLDQPNPDAQVRVDGQPAKLNEKISLLAGAHLFELMVKGKVTTTQSIDVAAKTIKPIQFNIQPAVEEKKPEPPKIEAVVAPTTPPPDQPKAPPEQPKAVSTTFTLSVASSPDGAEISIGKLKKKAPADFTDLDRTKTYPIKVSLKGYQIDPDAPKEVKWAEGDDPQKLSISLVPVAKAPPKASKPPPAEHPHPPKGDAVAAVPKPSTKGPKGTLIISSMPVGKVYVDGKDTGQWTPVIPARALSISAGTHQISLDDGNGHSALETVTITAGVQSKLGPVHLK